MARIGHALLWAAALLVACIDAPGDEPSCFPGDCPSGACTADGRCLDPDAARATDAATALDRGPARDAAPADAARPPRDGAHPRPDATVDAAGRDARPPRDAAPPADAQPPGDGLPPADAIVADARTADVGSPPCAQDAPPVGDPCPTGLDGPDCAEGRFECRNGQLTCAPPAGLGRDVPCNGLDDDCDGETDESGRVAGDVPEVCNNGLDEDCDGLVDGTLQDPTVCAGVLADQAIAHPMGVCTGSACPAACLVEGECLGGDVGDLCRHTEGCRQLEHLSPEEDERCHDPDRCPRLVQLSYPYALDREEVSIRAYRACVRAGCCAPPTGALWRRLEQREADGHPEPPRPAAPDGTLRPDDVDLDRHLLDLPVTGVSWCQARDYCAWAGKRLPTEYEWEHAAMGPIGAPRIYPWTDARDASLPDCPEDQGGRGVGWFATYNLEDTTCGVGRVARPSPVYANARGATPEGVLNLVGNVSEWVYDWYSPTYDLVATDDPVGLACDPTGPRKRITRGEHMVSINRRARPTNRIGEPPTVRAPLVGFRCGRTLDADAEGAPRLCDPGAGDIGSAAPACRPASADRPPCPGPDFAAANPGDADVCPDGRESTMRCGGGQRGCDSALEGPDCDAFLLTRLRLRDALLPIDEEAQGVVNLVFDSTLAPNGGLTYLALGIDDRFGIDGLQGQALFGTTIVDAGALRWRGVPLDGGGCAPGALSMDLRTLSRCPNADDPLCSAPIEPVCATDLGRAWINLTEMPASVQFGHATVEFLQHRPQQGTVQGLLTLYVGLELEQAAVLGDAAGATFYDDLRVPTVDFCATPIAALHPGLAGPGACDPPSAWPDLRACSDGRCTTPLACTGRVLPLTFEAARVDRLIAAGRLPELEGGGCAPAD